MIERLTVRNFILVDRLEIEFTQGFNVLTGETGAGKSILVGALSMLFGAKGDTDLVRSGNDEASVVGEFRVGGHAACLEWLRERDISPEDGIVLVRRSIKTAGRGAIHMQSVPVTRADLSEFAGFLLDLHSQHEHQSLFVETNHRRILDRFAGIEDQVTQFSEAFTNLGELQRQLQTIESREAERIREIEMLEFALEEISAVEPRPGEAQELENERHRMNEFEKLVAHVEAVTQLFDGSEYGILPMLKRARQEFSAAARVDGELSGEAERLDTSYYEIEDVAHALASYQEQLAFNPARLEEIEERLSALRRLFRKYGDTEQGVLAYAESAQSTLKELRSAEESRQALTRRIGEAEQDIGRRAREIHAARVSAADTLQARVREVLSDLAMAQAEFLVDIATRSNDTGRLICGSQGADRVRFLISTNPGEEPRPLSKIASGGEISRVMLAIKTVVAAVDDVRSLVFDEIDTGIGGQVALAIAAHMAELAQHSQVISITHLATIAVRADNHIVVEKSVHEGNTRISARNVVSSDREREIARMLAGDVEESHSVEHARALLKRYQREVNGKDQ
ncbi:MAG: DNA repair protein RecN [Alkalispirochaeta sp.]